MSESYGQVAEPPPVLSRDAFDDAGARLQETETLLRVARTIGATLDLPEVARRICREAARAVGADSAGIYLRGDDQILRPVAGYRVPKTMLDGLADAPLSVDEFVRLSEVLDAAADGVWSDDVATDPRFDHPVFRRFPARSLLCARLEAREEPVGVLLCAWWTTRHRPSAGEQRVIEGIAAQSAVAILNARLFAKAEEFAISRERLRMAHELHASLSQSLFSMGLSLDWCLHRADDDEMREKLEFARREAGTVLVQMRGLIQELAPGDDRRASFGDRLRRLVADVRELSGADVELIEHGPLERVSAAHQELLLRTFQEALANVVKHARAHRVRVWLVVLPDRIEFEVTDDGVGLPEHVTIPRLAELSGHLGLRQIVQRVCDAGGEVELARGAPTGFSIRGTLPVGRSGQ